MFKKVVNDKKNPNVYHEVEYEHIETRKSQKNNNNPVVVQPTDEHLSKDDAEDNQRLLMEYEGIYVFIGSIASAMSIDAELLLNRKKHWENQIVIKRVDRCTRVNENEDEEVEYLCFLRAVVTQDTYGAIMSVYNDLRVTQRGISLYDLIESPVTQYRFAELIALCSRKGADRSAQSGRLYMPQGNGKLAFNVHSGLQRSKLNARVIAHLRIWFSGIQKDSKGALYYSEPSFITQWKKENDTFY